MEMSARQRWTNWRAPEEKQWKQQEVHKIRPGEKIFKMFTSSEKRILGKAILRL